MQDLLVEGILFHLPLLAANAAIYLIFIRLSLDIPFDLGGSIGGRRIIGETRSLGGICVWVSVSTSIAMQYATAAEGVVLGLGGVLGTILNSSIKRRMGISNAPVLDQTDFMLGGLTLYWIEFGQPPLGAFYAVIAFSLLHWFVNATIRPRIEANSALPGEKH